MASLKSVPSKEVDTVHLGSAPSVARREGVLIMVGGIDAGRVLPIASGVVTTLGRAAECTFSFDDPGLSRVHAHLLVFGQEYVVQDASSRNGTFVNDARITGSEPTKLRHGDRVQIGALTFNFLLVDSEEVEALNRVFDAAVRDGLTNVYNRKHLHERLTCELSFAHRAGSEVSLVMFDVDHFKQVNDTYGHLAGDAVLRAVAHALGQVIRKEDTLARYGGEEFVIVCREIEAAAAMQMADRLRRDVEALPISVGSEVIHVTVSAGVAAISECETPDQQGLLGLADRRLYQAKSGGRNRVVGPARSDGT